MSDIAEDAQSRHSIPVIERLMDVLTALERHDSGLSITALTTELGLPRTTVYRILNSLQRHDMVRRDDAGAYHLGRRLLSLAAHVAAQASEVDLAAVAQPFLDRLAAEIGEGVKLSVLDEEGLLVLAAAQGKREYALKVTPGQRVPAHVGAASKVLLAHLPEEKRDRWISGPLVAYTARTVTDPRRLRSELARVRRLGWAQDRGEHSPSIHAFAAPVFADGRPVAALSVTFLAGTPSTRMEELRLAAISAAKAISRALDKSAADDPAPAARKAAVAPRAAPGRGPARHAGGH